MSICKSVTNQDIHPGRASSKEEQTTFETAKESNVSNWPSDEDEEILTFFCLDQEIIS